MPEEDDDRIEEPSDDEPISRGELRDLSQRFDALAGSIEELRQASTPAERREAREDVDETEDAFTRAAKASGLTREQIAKAVASAKDEAQYDGFKRLMKRYVDELPPEEEPKPKKQAAPSRKKAAQASTNGPVEDTGPVREHWSERRVSDLIK